MKKIFMNIILLILVCNIISNAQKPNISETTYQTWTNVSNAAISSDGRFALYSMVNDPIGSNTLTVKSTDLKWEWKGKGYSQFEFSNDSKSLFAIKGDTLIQLLLNSEDIIKTPNCNNYQLFSDGKNDWIIYQLTGGQQTLNVKNINTGKALVYNNIKNYVLNTTGHFLLFQTIGKDMESEITNLVKYNTGIVKKIYDGVKTTNFIFSPDGKNIAFTTNENGKTTIYHYNMNTKFAKAIATDNSDGILPGHCIYLNNVWRFTRDGKSLLFTQKKILEEKVTGVDVWNYKDAVLSPAYKKGFLEASRGSITSKIGGTNLTILNLAENKLVTLLKGTQTIAAGYDHDNDDVLLVSNYADISEKWNIYSTMSYYLCFTKTGELLPLNTNAREMTEPQLSPDNKYLFYYNPTLGKFVSYNVTAKTEKVFSADVHKDFHQYSAFNRGSHETIINGVASWVPEENKVILQGTYDLWLFDLENKMPPINITNDRIWGAEVLYSIDKISSNRAIKYNEETPILGYNIKTKQYSRHSVVLSKMIWRDLYTGDSWGDIYSTPDGQSFIKAEKANCYLIKAESASKSPNYFYSKDLKKLVPLSNNYPEKRYNWIKSVLTNYKDDSGMSYEGILYTPENYNSALRYPLILSYYLEQSSNVNKYLSPAPAGSGFNIPYLVSNGYIVFIPSIYESNGQPGLAALNSVNAAADYLVNKKIIDPSRIGLIGHSHGGFETNFIITHSTRFKAAASLAGVSNYVQEYNSIWSKGNSKQAYSMGFMGNKGMDVDPQKYIDHSAVLMANKIETPVLLMHNDNDTQVPVDQSRQFFVQLRALQKPAWFVQYDGEGHTLRKEENRLDFQMKLRGFFDHYLMDKAIPRWMNSPIQLN